MKYFVLGAALAVSGYAQTFTYDFETDYQGWTADFADYPVNDSITMQLQHKHQAMPGIAPAQNGIYLFGQNYSDDLFLFLKRKLTGLTPNATYSIAFTVDLATDMPPDGIGGGDLTLKAGATAVEPKKIVSGGLYRMNINKANQTQPGPDMDTLGHVHHNVPGSFAFHLVKFANKRAFMAKADAQGNLWLIIGAESAFEVGAPLNVAALSATLTGGTGLRRAARTGGPIRDGDRAYTLTGRRTLTGAGDGGAARLPTTR